MSPKARQSKGQARVTAYEKLLSQENEKVPRRPRDLHPARSAPGGYRHRVGQGHQSLTATRLHPGKLHRQHPARLDRGRGRSQRRGQDHPAEDDHRSRKNPTAAASALARRSSWPTPTRPAPSTPRRPSTSRSRGGADTLELGHAQDQRARLLLLVQLCRYRPAEEGRRALRRRAQPRAPGARR